MKNITTVASYIDGLSHWKEEMTLLRELVLSTDLEETIKWGGPCYTKGGQNILGLAAFKNYVGIWFFQGGLLKDEKKLLVNAQEEKTKAMRQWRFTSLNEIKKAPIRAYIKEAIDNSEKGLKIKASPKSPLPIPNELMEVMNNKSFKEKWDNLRPSLQREYCEYIMEGKKEETRLRRAEKCIEAVIAYHKK
jgi:uncharacterized protein YdeI (YjbR/CyaY-like superfamily)